MPLPVDACSTAIVCDTLFYSLYAVELLRLIVQSNLVHADKLVNNSLDESIRRIKARVDDRALLAAVTQERKVVFRV